MKILNSAAAVVSHICTSHRLGQTRRRIVFLSFFTVICFESLAQWTGQTSSSDLTTPISRVGFIGIDASSGAQIRLNSPGTYWGKIGNPSAQVWSLGWGGQGTDITPALSWNSSGNVGIGTTPLYPLHVMSPSADVGLRIAASGKTTQIALHVASGDYGYLSLGGNTSLRGNGQASCFDGAVGIGTTSPARPLHINNNGGGIVRLQSTTAIWDLQSDAFSNGNFGVVNYTGGAADATKSFMINGSTGNVGIGTTAPGSYKLAVEGKIGAREVNVTAASPWPDYVFEKNYKLPSLDEIKNYIDQNQRLPEVPSAKEVEKNGVNLGEMNALFLKKIEELTLHLIEQNKKTEEVNKMIAEMKRDNFELRKEIQDLKTNK